VADFSENKLCKMIVCRPYDRTYFQPIQYNRKNFIASLDPAKQEFRIERAKQGYEV
jgi:hypothetical protein